MSRDDYEAIKKIIDDIVGDTQQGNVLLKAIKGYFSQKETVTIVKDTPGKNSGGFSFNLSNISFKPSDGAQIAMDKYTKKLNLENAKYRKKREKETCSVSS